MPSHLGLRSASGRGLPFPLAPGLAGLVGIVGVSLALGLALPAQAQGVRAAADAPAAAAAAKHPTRAYWLDLRGKPAATSARGAKAVVEARALRSVTLDRSSLAALLATAPAEGSRAAAQNPLVIALPDPSGGFQRFAVVDSPVMEPGLAAKHPEIRTYAGRGIDDPTATVRLSSTPLGLQASVRSQKGGWYIDPHYHLDDSVYASYYRRDVVKPRTSFTERYSLQAQVQAERARYYAAQPVVLRGAGFAPGAQVTVTVRHATQDSAARQTLFAVADGEGAISVKFTADPYKATGSYSVMATDGRTTASGDYAVVADGGPLDASTGPLRREYRLALLTDPAYANYFGGSANVTAAKVALINRVTQIYEDETSIRLRLIANNDVLNLDTAAQFSGVNGPCGGTACYPTASVSCSSATLTRTRIVIGLLAGASNYDIGHIAVGAGGGGIASLGVVGTNNKAQGCTGLPTPTGDLFAVDYVAHEMGHQFAGNHTFNGTAGSCSGGNRSAANSYEPGSGSSIMAYAGICGATDDLQAHSDPYWSQRSFDEIVAYTSLAETNINEVQQVALTNYLTNGQQYVLRYLGADSAPIVRGTNNTTAGIAAAVQAIATWPAGGTVTVSALTDTGYTMTFSGALAGTNVASLQLVDCTGGCTGYVGEVAKGGITTRGGSTQVATGNSPPVVTAPALYTIPVRTPFALTGSATDPDGDTVTYLWEQNDRGAATGTNLVSNTKTNGPLFRQFGKIAPVTAAGTLLYNSPGENAVTTNPTRVFPDLQQILDGNTNAETGSCPASNIDCFSEFLPTAAYTGFAGVNAEPSLNFKVTARDGRGGVNSAATKLLLAPGAGPFLVTAPNTAITWDGASTQTVTWDVANTASAPVNTANVAISLSTDGGLTYPYVLASSTPNTGSKAVVMPNINTTSARIKVEAVGNVFFDVSNANFAIRLTGDVNGDGVVDCGDAAAVRAAFGTVAGQPGFNPAADVTGDGVINILDLVYVTRRSSGGRTCPV